MNPTETKKGRATTPNSQVATEIWVISESKPICLRSSNGTEHYAPIAAVALFTNLFPLLKRQFDEKLQTFVWPTVQLFADDDSLSVLLTLIRYGRSAAQPADCMISVKVERDATELGLSRELWGPYVAAWKHMLPAVAAEPAPGAAPGGSTAE